ncbi:MAG: hypothetical protein ACK4U0_09720 [Mesorhizobium sp.]
MDDAHRTDRTLRRIIATLVALAVLAERVACRSVPIRWFVLCLLRHAESVVRNHVAETTGWDWPDLEHAFGIGDADPDAGFDTDRGAGTRAGSGPADAMALVWRLRALAVVLRAFLPPDDLPGLDDPGAGVVAALRRLASGGARWLAASGDWTHPAPDTS